jgi:hypothetical protein
MVRLSRSFFVIACLSSTLSTHSFFPGFATFIMNHQGFKKALEALMTNVAQGARAVGTAATSGAQAIASNAAVKAVTQAATTGAQACGAAATQLAQGATKVVQATAQTTGQIVKGVGQGVASNLGNTAKVLINPIAGAEQAATFIETFNANRLNLGSFLKQFIKLPPADIARLTASATLQTATCCYGVKTTADMCKDIPERVQAIAQQLHEKLYGPQPTNKTANVQQSPAQPAKNPTSDEILAVLSNLPKEDQILLIAGLQAAVIKNLNEENEKLKQANAQLAGKKEPNAALASNK